MPSNYPSPPPPSGVQTSGSTGPFYNQHNETERGASPLPHGIQRLQSPSEARISGNDNRNDNASANNQALNENAENTETVSNSHNYAPNPDHSQMTYAQQAAHSGEEGRPATQEGFPPQTSPERLAQGVLSISEPQTQQQLIAAATEHHAQHQQPLQQSLQQSESSRRRNKNSRACDECRRKKIRCDSANEASNEVCTNCIKTGAICQFSRQPMKRGPNKGYIKGLADRVRSLENRSMPQGQMYLQQLQEEVEYPLPDQEDTLGEESFHSAPLGSRKRKLHPTGDGSLQHHSAKQAIQAFMQAPNYTPYYSPSEMAQATADATYDPFCESSDLSQASRADVDKAIYNFYVQDENELQLPLTIEWNQAVIDEHSPVYIQNVFLMTMDAFIHSLPASTVGPAENASVPPKEKWIPDASLATIVISTQTLILMMLQTDNRGPGSFDTSHGPSKAHYLHMAVTKAVSFKLNSLHLDGNIDEGDPDALDKVGRRVWWVLFILDRWHASSTTSPLLLPEKRISPSRDDLKLFGENTQYLIRFSYTMGNIATSLQQDTFLVSSSSAIAPIIAANLHGQIELIRELAESTSLNTPSLLQLVYWHVRLMIVLLTSSTKTREMIFVATRIATILNNSDTLITPLNHHFAGLSVMTLKQLSRLEETRDEAERGIKAIIEALTAKRGLMTAEDSEGWDQDVKKVALKTESVLMGADGSATAAAPSAGSSGREATTSTAGLQHLADAAIGGNDSNRNQRQQSQEPEGATFDPASIIRAGYLVALAQEEYGSA
ncbi:MAG: Glucose-responsive transcription factor [Alyxoria varia]|nr:MAG: Glucose-responsive transcription factor [Alyxoria varia]